MKNGLWFLILGSYTPVSRMVSPFSKMAAPVAIVEIPVTAKKLNLNYRVYVLQNLLLPLVTFTTGCRIAFFFARSHLDEAESVKIEAEQTADLTRFMTVRQSIIW